MQIHEITKRSLSEGFWGDLKTIGSAVASKSALSNISKGFVQGVAGVDFRDQKPADIAAAQAAQQALQSANERIVVTLAQPGQTVPAKYYKTGNAWTNELGTAITDTKQVAYLEKLIPTHGRKEAIPVMPAAPRKTISRRRVAR